MTNSYEQMNKYERYEVMKIYSSSKQDNLNLFSEADEYKLYVIDKLKISDMVNLIIGK